MNNTQVYLEDMVLSPLRRSMVVGEPLGELINTRIYVHAYAADIFVISSGKYEDILCGRIQKRKRNFDRLIAWYG